MADERLEATWLNGQTFGTARAATAHRRAIEDVLARAPDATARDNAARLLGTVYRRAVEHLLAPPSDAEVERVEAGDAISFTPEAWAVAAAMVERWRELQDAATDWD